MRTLRKNKNFSNDTKDLFVDNYSCWLCGRNTWDCGHHIFGGNFEEADSPLNFAPLCNFSCHLGRTFSDKQKTDFAVKTLQYLLLRGYTPTIADKTLIRRYRGLYIDSVKGAELLKWQDIKI